MNPKVVPVKSEGVWRIRRWDGEEIAAYKRAWNDGHIDALQGQKEMLVALISAQEGGAK